MLMFYVFFLPIDKSKVKKSPVATSDFNLQLQHSIAKSPTKKDTACAFDICLYLTPLGQARQFIETCGT